MTERKVDKKSRIPLAPKDKRIQVKKGSKRNFQETIEAKGHNGEGLERSREIHALKFLIS